MDKRAIFQSSGSLAEVIPSGEVAAVETPESCERSQDQKMFRLRKNCRSTGFDAGQVAFRLGNLR